MLVWGNIIYNQILRISWLHKPVLVSLPPDDPWLLGSPCVPSSLDPVAIGDRERSASEKAAAEEVRKSACEGTEEPVTIEEQIDRLGFRRFQMIVLAAFILFQVAEGIQLSSANVIWRALPHGDMARLVVSDSHTEHTHTPSGGLLHPVYTSA